MTRSGLRRLKAPIRCPECGRGVFSFKALKQHAAQTGCDISDLMAEVYIVCMQARLAAVRVHC